PPAASAKMDAAAAWTSTNPASAAPRSAAPRPKWVVANDTAAGADDRSTANNSACPTLNARPAGRRGGAPPPSGPTLSSAPAPAATVPAASDGRITAKVGG